MNKFFKINMDDDEDILTTKRRVNSCWRVSKNLENFTSRWCIKVKVGSGFGEDEEEFGIHGQYLYKIAKEGTNVSRMFSALNNGGGEDG